ncbi:hypothetical protein Hypma_013661 [Hypsizygus marmoreus]|uniref:Uncharacterized protein n=1 Tax=Hypsizygus marmoreus TaxID=39966 RepID=A0A369JJE6_HYPMA|nr:hypothetical protein Hypma_013661 [Hypsizygus marmoreus]
MFDFFNSSFDQSTDVTSNISGSLTSQSGIDLTSSTNLTTSSTNNRITCLANPIKRIRGTLTSSILNMRDAQALCVAALRIPSITHAERWKYHQRPTDGRKQKWEDIRRVGWGAAGIVNWKVDPRRQP